jgi:hypothetical protein
LHTTVLRSFAVALALVAMACPTAAQTISGHVQNDASGNPLESVHVVLLDEEGDSFGETFTNGTGWFRLVIPRSGTWIIAADLIGYGFVQSEPIEIEPDERVTVEIKMAVEAIPMEPVVVTGRVSHMNGDIQEFYDRVERGKLSGFGRFVTREDIERGVPMQPSDLLRTMPGVRVMRRATAFGSGSSIQMSGGCVPAIFVDGSQINRFRASDDLDDFVAAHSIEGIEVYRGAGQQVGRFHDDRGCGLILVWTRRGTADGSPFTWTRFIIGASLLAGMLLLH